MRLPVEYQEVEYITNTAGAYIDTGVVVKGGLGFELKAAFQEGQATNSEFFGGGTSYRNAIGICTHNSGTLGVYVGTTEIFAYPWYELHTIKVDTDGSAYKDGLLMGQSTTTPSTTSNTMQIFRHSGTGVVQLEIVYFCKLFDSAGTLRNLVPCYRKADNVVGMYDIQNDVFYTNASTSGEFIAGDDVTDSDVPEQETNAGYGSIDLIRRNMMMAADVVPSDAIIVAKRSDNEAAIMEVVYAQGWSASPKYMTKREAEKVTILPNSCFKDNTRITDLSVLQYFTSLHTLNTGCISDLPNLVSIKLPLSIEKVNLYAFDVLPSLIFQELNLPNCTYVSSYGFGRNNMGGFANGARIYAPNLYGKVEHYPFSTTISKIRYLYIGDRVTELVYPFIPNLKNALTVVCMAQTPPSITSGNTCPGKVLYVPRVSLDAYMSDELWSSAYKNIYAIEDIDPQLLAYMTFQSDELPQ